MARTGGMVHLRGREAVESQQESHKPYYGVDNLDWELGWGKE